MIGLKTARLQKPHLPRLVLEVAGPLPAKLFQAHLAGQFMPVLCRLVKTIGNNAACNALIV